MHVAMIVRDMPHQMSHETLGLTSSVMSHETLGLTSSVMSQSFKAVDVIMNFFIGEKPLRKHFEKNSIHSCSPFCFLLFQTSPGHKVWTETMADWRNSIKDRTTLLSLLVSSTVANARGHEMLPVAVRISSSP